MKLKTLISIVFFLFLTIIESAPATAQTKRAFLVGISDYGNPANQNNLLWNNIHGAVDVSLIKPILSQQGFADIVTLTDADATKAEVIKGIKSMGKKCKKGDIVYLHFSMHGQMIEDLDGDEGDGWDEALCPYDSRPKYQKGVYEGEKHLLDDELEPLITSIRKKIGPTGIVYVIMDACHSGGSMRTGDDDKLDDENECGLTRGTPLGFSADYRKSGKAYKENVFQPRNYVRQSNESSVIYVEACQPNQVNKEYYRRTPELQCGSLTYAIVTLLQNGTVIDNDGIWTSNILNEMRKFRRNGNTPNTQVPLIESSR